MSSPTNSHTCKLCGGEGIVIADDPKLAKDTRVCPYCNGTRTIADDRLMPICCYHCYGSGIIDPFMDCPDKSYHCELCKGSGEIIADDICEAKNSHSCKYCNGHGKVIGTGRMPIVCTHCYGSGIVDPFMDCPDKSHTFST